VSGFDCFACTRHFDNIDESWPGNGPLCHECWESYSSEQFWVMINSVAAYRQRQRQRVFLLACLAVSGLAVILYWCADWRGT